MWKITFEPINYRFFTFKRFVFWQYGENLFLCSILTSQLCLTPKQLHSFSFACAMAVVIIKINNGKMENWKRGTFFVCASTSNAIVRALKYFFCHFVWKKTFTLCWWHFYGALTHNCKWKLRKNISSFFSFAYRSIFLNFRHIFTLSLSFTQI